MCVACSIFLYILYYGFDCGLKLKLNISESSHHVDHEICKITFKEEGEEKQQYFEALFLGHLFDYNKIHHVCMEQFFFSQTLLYFATPG